MEYRPPADCGLTVLLRDDHLLVVDKPAGLLSVPGRGSDKGDCLIRRVQQRFPDALIVHRLDMGTSGLLVLARGAPMQRALSLLFQERRVHKTYVALVAGVPPAAGTIDLPLRTDWPNRPRQQVDPVHGKPSLTRYRVCGWHPELQASRVELEPLTGRSHQLRVHLQALGHPILGDELYADPSIRDRAPRLLLHACRLAFAHPATGQPIVVSSPADF